MVVLSVTPAMQRAIAAVEEASGASLAKEETALLGRLREADRASLDDLRRLARIARARGASDAAAGESSNSSHGTWLHEMVKGSVMVSAPSKAVPRERDPALVARLAKLEVAAQNREYARMVRDITNQDTAREMRATEIASFKDSIGVGANLLVSIGTMFTVGWFVTKNSLGAGPTEVLPIIGGLVGAALTLLLESWLFIIRTSRVDSAASKREKVSKDALSRTRQQEREYADLSRLHDHYD